MNIIPAESARLFAQFPLGSSRVTAPWKDEMESRDFCYWLQGFFELRPGSEPLDAAQIALVKRHLDLVFQHKAGAAFRENPGQAEPRPVAPPEPAPLPATEPKDSPTPPPLPPQPPPPAPMC